MLNNKKHILKTITQFLVVVCEAWPENNDIDLDKK